MTHAEDKILLRETAEFFMRYARELETMAEVSETGGWSTHQCRKQRDDATMFHAKAAVLYQAANRGDIIG